MANSPAQSAKDIEQFFSQMGVSLSPQSRIRQCLDAMNKGGVIQPDDSRFPAAREGLRDVLLLDFSLSQLKGITDCTTLKRLLQRISKDHLLPQDDLKNSPGRDTQTEMYVAAIASKAGLKPRFSEPDILCELAGVPIGIAVKRIKNEDRFEEHFRKAASQIERTKVRGVIVTDMTLAFNRTNIVIEGSITPEQMNFAHKKARKLFVGKYYDRMKDWLGGREVRGLIIMDSILHVESWQRWYVEAFGYDVPFNLHNERRHREWSNFREVFLHGYPTPAIKDQ